MKIISLLTVLSCLAFTTMALANDVCTRSYTAKMEFEKQFKKPCAKITDNDLASFTGKLYLDGELKTGDLDGLFSLPTLGVDGIYGAQLELPEGLFSDLKSLKSLGVSRVKMPSDENVFESLGSLEELYFFGTVLQAEINAKTFKPLKMLKKLEFTATDLTSIPENYFIELKTLHSLEFSNSPSLRTLSPNAFRGLSNLESLTIANASLEVLSPDMFANLTALKFLTLNGLGLTEPPHDLLKHLPRLQGFWMCYGKLTNLSEDFFQYVPHLQRIGLWHSSLNSLPEDIFRNLIDLQYLSLDKTKLTSLPAGLFEGLIQLKLIGLAENNIPSLPPKIFQGLESLEELQFESTGLRSLTPDLFQGLQSLSRIVLYNNHITTLPDRIFADLPKLHFVNLSSVGGGQPLQFSEWVFHPQVFPKTAGVKFYGTKFSTESMKIAKKQLGRRAEGLY